jgi:thiamine biosynthesis lipoprotein
MGTVCQVNLYEEGRAKIYDDVFKRLREIEEVFSSSREDSELSRVNSAAGAAPVPVSGEFIEILGRALYYREISGGAFDPAIGPLVKLWGIGGENERVPSEGEIAEALALVRSDMVEIDGEAGTVRLALPGMALDLGGIVKGYAADEAARIISGAGLKRAMIDLGGNIYALGEKSGGLPWRIGLQNPDGDRGDYIAVIEVKNKSVVTSGVYERYFEAEDSSEGATPEAMKRYHHILDPATGRPAESGLLSATIVSGRSIDGDALSTAAFVLGPERGLSLAESVGVEAAFVCDDGRILKTAGLLLK